MAMIPEKLDSKSLRDAATRAFQDSLSFVESKLKEAQAEVAIKQQALDLAIAERDKYAKDKQAYTELIERWSVDDEEEFDDMEDSTDSNDPNEIQKQRRRLNTQPKTLELIKKGNVFVSVEDVITLVMGAYEPGAIKEKTIKNAVWNLTGEGQIIKFYDKDRQRYIYGLPEWFNGDKPNSQYMGVAGATRDERIVTETSSPSLHDIQTQIDEDQKEITITT